MVTLVNPPRYCHWRMETNYGATRLDTAPPVHICTTHNTRNTNGPFGCNAYEAEQRSFTAFLEMQKMETDIAALRTDLELVRKSLVELRETKMNRPTSPETWL